MQELTSQYDDLEKRMAIYLGLGAMLFTSLYLFTKGATPWDYLIRGVLALAAFSIVGWGYGHWLRALYRQHSSDEQLPENTERQSRDAHAVEGRVVTHAEMPEVVIPGEPAEPEISDFNMPAFDSPMIPSKEKAKSTPLKAAAAPAPLPMMEEEGDLPPPPVPAGV